MEGEFTPKEIEAFGFLHDFRQNTQSGEITITFHNGDFNKLSNIRFDISLTGKGVNPVFYEKLMIVMLGQNKEKEA